MSKPQCDLNAPKCSFCGTQRALQYDHVDPTTKKFALSSPPPGATYEQIQEEKAKCRLLCANCHNVRSCEDGHRANSSALPPKEPTRTQQCQTCQETLPLSEFFRSGNRRRKSCKACYNASRAKNSKLLARYKRMKGCTFCGYREDARALCLVSKLAGAKKIDSRPSKDAIRKAMAERTIMCFNCLAENQHAKT